MNKYITKEDKEQVMKDTIYRETAINALYNEKRNLLAMDADRPANGVQVSIKVIESLPSADRPNEVIYGNEHNCIMTIFGECSYAETGCGDCAVVEKVRKALSSDRPQGEWVDMGGYEVCKKCHEVKRFPHWNYCPNCGSRMIGADDDYD